jgi:8-oxo-dGTP pyrophosphatase MutT (NUDIX family)
MSWKPDLTVAAIVERDGRFLMVEERIANNMVFNQPAGHVEAGESIVDAVVRETLEETAWQFEPHAFLGIYLLKPPQGVRSYLRLAFIGSVSNHDPKRPLDRGIRRALWLSREQLIERQDRLRSPLVLSCIDDAIAGRRYPLDAIRHLGFDAPDASVADSTELTSG